MSLVSIGIGMLVAGVGIVITLRPKLLFKLRDPPFAPPGTPQREGVTLAYQFIGVCLLIIGGWMMFFA
ncbi:MAG: hypothetical protein SVG88_07230 [Halobacteriales archaeon]|nr:hypothetical protein [Halobacteriales archaeon]